MTANEKHNLAAFFGLAAAVTSGGYRDTDWEYCFYDDTGLPVPAESAVVKTESSDGIERVIADIRSCTACALAQTRNNMVPGEGATEPIVMIIGEGPGVNEDASGRPFVGAAGQLLDKMLAAIGLSRETNCYIANVIKCRPPANRDPQPDETAACAGFLARQIQLLKPRFILCAGRVAAQTLLTTTEPVSRLRGRFFDFQAGDRAIPLLPTYHPSALLRNEDLKRPAWEDLKLLRSALTEAGLAVNPGSSGIG